MKKTALVLVLLGLVLFLGVGCGDTSTDPAGPTRRVAVYNGAGADSDFAGAVKAALEANGRVVDLVDEGQMQSDLTDFGLVIISAGDPVDMATALGYTGRERIKGLVNAGGGFIGLGTGAYLAADSMSYQGVGSLTETIGFYHGVATGPIAALASSGHVLANVNITDLDFDPGTSTSFESMYFEGPEFRIESSIAVRTIARYSATSTIASLGFEYGPGRVALCSFNPEIEENDSRDGTTFGDDLVDPDSEWFFLQTLVAYCLHETLIGG